VAASPGTTDVLHRVPADIEIDDQKIRLPIVQRCRKFSRAPDGADLEGSVVQAEGQELDKRALREKKNPPVPLERAEGTNDATYKLSAPSGSRPNPL
jgi:hypothetical protein